MTWWPISLALILCTPLFGASHRPNILFCITDDQSWAHTGANGDSVVKTPTFDRVAAEGIRFTHSFSDAPTCGPSRSAILTGQPIWRLEEAANIWSTLPAKFATYTGQLKQAGYRVGYTGKGWAPGRIAPGGRTENPAGKAYTGRRISPPFRGIRNVDYAGNFDDFLSGLTHEEPFCFWLGTSEPHRAFERGSGRKAGKDPARVVLPPIFPDHDVVRNDLLDYFVEIEHADTMFGRAIDSLERRHWLENTMVVISSDHGMPFPRGKATLYDDGTRVPLAIRWGAGIQNPGRIISQPVNLSALAPTFLEAAGLPVPQMMTAHSLMDLFRDESPSEDQAAFIALERHSGARAGGKGYPSRAIRTHDFLYIYNFEPSRWPAGSPDPQVCNRLIAYGEYDPSPTKTFMMEHQHVHGLADLAELSFGKHPAEELYDVRNDPHQMLNLTGSLKHLAAQQALRERLFEHLRKTRDPRVVGGAVNWDFYPHYGNRTNPNWEVTEKPH